MQKKCLVLIARILVLLISIQSQAEQTNKQNWRSLAQSEKLSENAIEKLEQDNIVITDTAYKQIFTPYIGDIDINNNIPLFITTDSLINAYHVLY